METHLILGFVLIFAAATEAVVGILVIGPKAPPEKRNVVVGAIIGGALIMAALGVAFLMKMIPI